MRIRGSEFTQKNQEEKKEVALEGSAEKAHADPQCPYPCVAIPPGINEV